MYSADNHMLAHYQSLNGTNTFTIKERYLYGSDMLGKMAGPNAGATYTGNGNIIGPVWPIFDMKDQLGNNRIGFSYFSTGVQANISNDYYAFGWMMSQKFGGPTFGFNGKQIDDIKSGLGTLYNYGAREYDPRISRFMSIDPLFKQYSMLSNYQFASDIPIWAKDLDGKEAEIIDFSGKTFTILANVYYVTSGRERITGVEYLQKQVQERILNQIPDANKKLADGWKANIKINSIVKDENGNPLTYEAAKRMEQNSTVDYTDLQGKRQKITSWRNGVIVMNDMHHELDDNTLAVYKYKPNLKNNGASGTNIILLNDNFMGHLYKKGAEFVHELGHFLGVWSPNENKDYGADHPGGIDNGDPGVTSTNPDNVILQPADLNKMKDVIIQKGTVRSGK